MMTNLPMIARDYPAPLNCDASRLREQCLLSAAWAPGS
jgi:hypothetical protein